MFRIGRYIVFFWSNENDEPIHVHIGVVDPSPNATKIWLTKGGGCIVANNLSKMPKHELNKLSTLPFLYKDPFDILIIASALADSLTVITIDEKIQ